MFETAAVRRGLSAAGAGTRRWRAREDTWGGYRIQRGRLNPYRRLFGQVTSRTRRGTAYDRAGLSGVDTERR
jgi:hypothetical protein